MTLKNNVSLVNFRDWLSVSLLLVFGFCSGASLQAASRSDDSGSSLYDPKHLLEIKVTMDPSDWMELRLQHPDRLGQMQGRDSNPEPYTMFRAKVAIDGIELSNIGIRKKGNLGSVVSHRPSLKLDFNQFSKKQHFQGVKGLTLNNNHQNPATLHQFIAYHLFRKAGLPAPRCGLAHIEVNGEDLGVYSNVEPIKKAFLKRFFGKSSGHLYESGGEFEGEAYRYFPRKNNRDNKERPALLGITEALAKPDDQVLMHLEKFLDLEAFYRFWAMDVLIGDWDGFICNRNNAYLYNNPKNNRLYLIPWGMDSIFEDPGIYFLKQVPKAVKAVSFLPQRLYGLETSQKRYLQVMQEMLNEVWDEDELGQLIDNAKGLIGKRLHIPEATFIKEMKSVENFIQNRRSEIQRELDAGTPEWPSSANRQPMSGGQLTISSKFEGKWSGSITKSKIEREGRNEIHISFGGDSNERVENVVAYAGLETQALRIGYPVILLEGTSRKLGDFSVRLYVDPFKYGKKQEYTVDFYEAMGVITRRHKDTNRLRFTDFLGFAFGQLSLSESSSEIGEAVSGEFGLQVMLK